MHPILFVLNKEDVFNFFYLTVFTVILALSILLFYKNIFNKSPRFFQSIFNKYDKLIFVLKFVAGGFLIFLVLPIFHFLFTTQKKFFLDTYSVLFSSGYTFGVFFAYFQAKKIPEISQTQFLYFITVLLISSVLGAKLFSALFDYQTPQYYPPYAFFNNPLVLFTGQIGFVIYGGLIFAVIAGYIFLKVQKLPAGKVADIAAPSLFLGLTLGRAGCFFNGCCFGKCASPSILTLPWNSFTNNSPAFNFYYGTGHCEIINTQLISSLFALIMFCIFLYICLKRQNFFKHGQILSLAFLIYSVFRFFIEFYRGDNPALFLGMTVSQLISIIVFIASLSIIIKIQITHGKTRAKL